MSERERERERGRERERESKRESKRENKREGMQMDATGQDRAHRASQYSGWDEKATLSTRHEAHSWEMTSDR